MTRIGMFMPFSENGQEESAARLGQMAAAGIDHVGIGDHVSFFGGLGFDGLIRGAALAAMHPTLPVYTGVYLLPLRHPVLVARQLSDIAQLAPGRLIFGVGVGGEDRHESEVCGVDPATRGQRMNECLTVLRQLMTGQPVTHHGTFFDLTDAVVDPAAAVPIIVGGRSDAAVRRAGVLGDGWLGIWNSPARFAVATAQAAEAAAQAGRTDWAGRHGMQLWCGFGATREAGRAQVAPAMELMYQISFERFEKYTPCGTPDDVAEFLRRYVEAGCSEFNLIAQAADADEAIAAVAAVRKLLVSA
jgi:alkanesulfonate monooxygenase SsuD/methylene tetrahydromethanopterin reductase-like flavin-dependent oxidoreductase (luciferase family)